MARSAKAESEELRKMSDADMQKKLDETYKRLFSLRLQKETLQLTNHREIPAARREIARIKTFQRQRELAKAAGGQS
jgi:large subunit ribosomal protein L29